ncbi:LOG family protein [uncultured Corynebacterium sp.]|uniref:LOG family protein n=1 Tax=uncultured Corynebacterium sp. TaxID=159447 RepID=UPI0025CD792E|nr:LOG family protein [uncultured Corynebacterium sp.]
MPFIRVSAAIIRNRDGQFLLVRKKDTTAFMFPGGKPEPGETPDHTLIRELDEELNLRVGTEDLTFVGTFRTNAANEANTQLLADVFTLKNPLNCSNSADDGNDGDNPDVGNKDSHDVTPHAEIDVARWFTSEDIKTEREPIAPLTREVVPQLYGRGFLLFTGSAMGNNPVYREAVESLVHSIGVHNDHIVYGGGRAGLMGVVGDTAAEDGTLCIGVIPYLLAGVDGPHGFNQGGRSYIVPRDDGTVPMPSRGEIAHGRLTRLELVPTMSTRKMRMGELADIVVGLPGGAGTVDELFDAWTQQQLGYTHHAVALLNVNGYWDPLISAINHMVAEGFLSSTYRESLIIADTPCDLYEKVNAWVPPAPKWG